MVSRDDLLQDASLIVLVGHGPVLDVLRLAGVGEQLRSWWPGSPSLSLVCAAVYDTLLALHLLSAAIAFVTIAMFSAWAVGAPVTRPHFALADAAWNVSGAGLVVFGVWLAIDVDGYEVWDGWILASLALLVAAGAFGARARAAALAMVGPGAAPAAAQAALWHWLRTATVVAILVLMVWKPGT